MADYLALFVGGPYHLRKMALKDPNQFLVARIPELELSDPDKPLDMVEHSVVTYKPRKWFGSEVWVVDEMSDAAAMDQLLTSVFNKRGS